MDTTPKTLPAAKPGLPCLIHLVLLIVSATVGYVFVYSIRNSAPLRAVSGTQTHIARSSVVASTESSDSQNIAAIPISADTFEDHMTRLLALDSKRQKAWEIEAYFETLTKESAPELFELIKDQPSYKGYTPHLFKNWGAIDPLAALGTAESLDGIWKGPITKSVFDGWAKQDVHAAWSAAATYLSDKERNKRNVGRPVMKEMIVQDPDFLIAVVNSDTMHSLNSSIRAQMTNYAFEEGSPLNFIQKLETIANPQVRAEWTKGLFDQWGENAPDDALIHLEQIQSSGEADAAAEGFLFGWSKHDSQAALDFALAHQEDQPVKNATARILDQYIRNGSDADIQSLIEHAANSPNPNELTSKIAQTLAYTKPAQALALAEQLEASPDTQDIIGGALHQLSEKDFDAAESYYLDLEPAARQQHLPSLVHSLYAREDGGEKINRLLNSVPETKERSDTINRLVHNSVYQLSLGNRSYFKALKEIALESTELTEANRKLLSSAVFDL